MNPLPSSALVRLGPLLALLLLQGGCLSEVGDEQVGLECGPRDLTPECCLKKNPGDYERCTGTSALAQKLAQGAGVVVTVAAVAVQPALIPAERRGTELAADLLLKLETALEQCAREADRQVNEDLFDGRSPDQQLCNQPRVSGLQQTWGAYLGMLKHVEAWPCLRKKLDELVPGHYLLQPRYQYNVRHGRWEYMNDDFVSQVVSRLGWKGLEGTIAPDLVILDAKGLVVYVYDLKFPCPETNDGWWRNYTKGPWMGENQGSLYQTALGVEPLLVTPQGGVIRKGLPP